MKGQIAFTFSKKLPQWNYFRQYNRVVRTMRLPYFATNTAVYASRKREHKEAQQILIRQQYR